jgi:hypothetical protein
VAVSTPSGCIVNDWHTGNLSTVTHSILVLTLHQISNKFLVVRNVQDLRLDFLLFSLKKAHRVRYVYFNWSGS